MKNTTTSIKVFSPEGKEAWSYEAQGFSFSTQDREMFAVEAVGVDWSVLQSLLLSCVGSTLSKVGFFRVTPWFPGRGGLRDALLELFPNCKAVGFDVFGYIGIASGDLELLLDLWQKHGAWSSGEWQIGGCHAEFQEPVFKTSYSGLEYFLREIHNVTCVLSLEEMQQSTLLTCPFVGLTEKLKALKQAR